MFRKQRQLVGSHLSATSLNLRDGGAMVVHQFGNLPLRKSGLLPRKSQTLINRVFCVAHGFKRVLTCECSEVVDDFPKSPSALLVFPVIIENKRVLF
mgnify:CR=1 FL=1